MRIKLVLFLILILALLQADVWAQPLIVVVEIKGRIDEGAYYTLKKAVAAATRYGAQYLIVVIDSYGGYLYSMDKIISEISKCPSPCIVWIPPGGKAVSAGAIVALSGDDILVGEGSVLGACKPYPADEKVVQYVKARIRSLAERRNLNESVILLLEEMVTRSRAFSASELLSLGLVTRYANSLNEVLNYLNVSNAKFVKIEADVVSEIASIIFDPGIASMMLIIGILLIILELKATGFQGWGVVGGVMVAIALYVYGFIGWNLMTLTLILLGITAIIAELKKPGIQVFGAMGISMMLLAILLEYMRQPYIDILSYAVPILAFTGVVSGVILVVIIKAAEAIRMKKLTIRDKLMGKEGIAKTSIKPGGTGVVHVEGEDWTATSSESIDRGSRVKVIDVEGLTVIVEKVK